MKLLLKLFDLIKDNRAAASIEFAIAGPVYFIFFVGMGEVGLMWWGNSVIANSVADAARRAQIGCVDNLYKPESAMYCLSKDVAISDSAIRDVIQSRSFNFVRVGSDAFNMRYNYSIPFKNLAQANNIDGNPKTLKEAYCSSGLVRANSVMVILVRYDWGRFVPFQKVVNALGVSTRFQSVAFFRTEAYGAALSAIYQCV